MRLISFSMTKRQIRERTKTVTRRVGWLFLKEGTLLQPVEKAQGLKKGESPVHLGGLIRVVSVRRELLSRMVDDQAYGACEVAREGFGGHPTKGTPAAFVEFFAASHGCSVDSAITRIEFAYVEPAP